MKFVKYNKLQNPKKENLKKSIIISYESKKNILYAKMYDMKCIPLLLSLVGLLMLLSADFCPQNFKFISKRNNKYNCEMVLF